MADLILLIRVISGSIAFLTLLGLLFNSNHPYGEDGSVDIENLTKMNQSLSKMFAISIIIFGSTFLYKENT